ncbi:MAG: cupin domain-containing protein [Casimicrobiaceae bacterium]
MPYSRSQLASPLPLLGNRSPQAFMQRFWQKKALLIRSAIEGFIDPITPEALFRLAQSRAVESRLILNEAGTWRLEHGPFRKSRWQSLPARNWTLLVQGLNHHVAAAERLLRRFDFVPLARLDDVMVSVAAPGGGVGPHFDSYDVFLLQGQGVRRWALSRQRDLQLAPEAPLKLLKQMRVEESHDLVGGDMLYLPPRVAHDGVAIQESGLCTTYSIGFRAPGTNETAHRWLDWLADTLDPDDETLPRDPDLCATTTPARMPRQYVQHVRAALARLPTNPDAIAEFAGCLATHPKANTVWSPPGPPLGRAAFKRQAIAQGVRFAAQTRALYDAKRLYVNGEAFEIVDMRDFWRDFADERATELPPSLPAAVWALLYAWYVSGWVRLGNGDT